MKRPTEASFNDAVSNFQLMVQQDPHYVPHDVQYAAVPNLDDICDKYLLPRMTMTAELVQKKIG